MPNFLGVKQQHEILYNTLHSKTSYRTYTYIIYMYIRFEENFNIIPYHNILRVRVLI
jgi:hypothetical protein